MTTATPAIDKTRSVASAVPIRSAPRGHDESRPDPDRWMALAALVLVLANAFTREP